MPITPICRVGYFWARGTEADVRKVIEYYTQATVLDPLFCDGLGAACLGRGLDSARTTCQAHPLKRRARTLSCRCRQGPCARTDLAAAHSARSWLLQAADFDWHGGEAEARRALELAPNNVMAKSDLAAALGILGDPVRAIELQQEAIKLDPLRPESYMWLANFLVALDRLDEAEHAIRKAIELRPSGETYFGSLASIEVLRGNAQAALLLAQKDPDESTRDFAADASAAD